MRPFAAFHFAYLVVGAAIALVCVPFADVAVSTSAWAVAGLVLGLIAAVWFGLPVEFEARRLRVRFAGIGGVLGLLLFAIVQRSAGVGIVLGCALAAMPVADAWFRHYS